MSVSSDVASEELSKHRQLAGVGQGVVSPDSDFLGWLRTRQEQWNNLRREAQQDDNTTADQEEPESESLSIKLAHDIQQALREAGNSPSAPAVQLLRRALDMNHQSSLTSGQLMSLLPLLAESGVMSTSSSVRLEAESIAVSTSADANETPKGLPSGNCRRRGPGTTNLSFGNANGSDGVIKEEFSRDTTSYPLPKPSAGPVSNSPLSVDGPKTKFLFKNKPFMGWVKEFRLIEEGPNQGRLSVAYLNPNASPPAVITSPGEAAAMLSKMTLSKELKHFFDFSAVFCICHEPEDSKRYVECAVGRGGCSGWIHMDCVGLSDTLPDHALEPMACPLCTNYAIDSGNQHWLTNRKILSSAIPRSRIYGDYGAEAHPPAVAEAPTPAQPRTRELDKRVPASAARTVLVADAFTSTHPTTTLDDGYPETTMPSHSGDDIPQLFTGERVLSVGAPHELAPPQRSGAAPVNGLARSSTLSSLKMPTSRPPKAGGFAISSNLASQLNRKPPPAAVQTLPQPAASTPPNPTQPMMSTIIEGLEIQSSYLPHFQYGLERSEDSWPQFATSESCETAMMGWGQACQTLYARTCGTQVQHEEGARTSKVNGVPKQEPEPQLAHQQGDQTLSGESLQNAPPRQHPKLAAAPQSSSYVSPYAGFLVSVLTAEDEDAASQLLGKCATADLPDGRTRKVFVQGGWMFAAAARRNMELAEARRQNSKIPSSLFSKHKAELFRIAVRCASSNKERKRGAKWVGPAFASMPAEDGGLRTICVGHSREVKSLKEHCEQQNRCIVCLAPLSRTAGAAIAKQSKRRIDHANGRTVEEVHMNEHEHIIPDSQEPSQSRKRSKREVGTTDRHRAMVHTRCKQKVLMMLEEDKNVAEDIAIEILQSPSKRSLDQQQNASVSEQTQHCSLCSLEDGLLVPFRREDRERQWAHPMCVMWFQSNFQQGGHGHCAPTTPNENTAGSRQFRPASEVDGCTLPTHVRDFGRCAMCGTQGGESVRCAIYGCYVRMHPLCALVESCYSGVARPKRPDVQGRMLSVPFLLCPYHSTTVQNA